MLSFPLQVEVEVGPGQNQFTMQRPEGTRTYYAWQPKSYNQSGPPVPLLFAFHGLGDSCTNFGQSTGFIDYAEKYNFILVYPCGSQGLLGTAWNAGTCCLNPSSIDDVQFTRLMIAEMSKVFHINSSRVYTSGFSNGAMMSEILTCEAANLFAASASVSGVVELVPGNSEGEAKCDQYYQPFYKAIPTVNIHGTIDFLVPWTGDAILGFPPIPDNFAYWAKRNGCKGNPVQTFSKGTFSNQIYQTCNNGSVVELVKNDGGGHEWPRNANFDTTAFIVSFFSLDSKEI